MRILLTGATGFVGSHLLRGLLKDGHEICIGKRSGSDLWRIRDILKDCRAYDLDKTDINRICSDWPAECIVHCATHYVRDNREYYKNINSNLLFPLELLSTGKDYGVRYFINTSSFFEKQLAEERNSDQGIYSYSYVLSKSQFSQWGRMFAAEYGMYFVNMRLEHVYGEMDRNDKFIPYLVNECRKNRSSLALSEGTQQRDFIYVSDVINAYRAVIADLENHKRNGYVTYEVGTGKMRSLREFVEIIHRAVHSTTNLLWGTVPMGKGELMQSCADNLELRKLGWKPEVVSESDIEHVFGGGGKRVRSLNVEACRPGRRYA